MTQPNNQPRHLEYVHLQTREVAQRVDVTGRSEREVERCLRGMLINISDDYFVRDTADGAGVA